MDRTISLISLGCAKNLVNSEQMLYLLSEAGYTLVPEPDGADAVIINTCGFIDAAKSEAIDTVLEMAELKKAGKLGKIIVIRRIFKSLYSDIIISIVYFQSVFVVNIAYSCSFTKLHVIIKFKNITIILITKNLHFIIRSIR